MLYRVLGDRNPSSSSSDGRPITQFEEAPTTRCEEGEEMANCREGLALTFVITLIASLTAVAAPAQAAPAPLALIDTAPVREISGGATGFGEPRDIALDAAGNHYVSNTGLSTITVHSPTASGNAVPTRTIAGPLTGLSFPVGVDVDSAGFVYVASYGNNSIRVFAPGATGNVAPVRVISGPASELVSPTDLELAPDGSIVTAQLGTDAVTVHRGTAGGAAAPVRTIQGSNTQLLDPYSLAISSSGELYVGSFSGAGTVNVFAPGVTGNSPPIRRLVGATSDFTSVTGLSLDSDDNLYLASSQAPHRALLVFGKGADAGDEAKVRLEGPASKLTFPGEVLVLPNHRVLVTNPFIPPEAVFEYAPLVAKLVAPGKVRALKVKRAATAKKRPVTWRLPAQAGNPEITGYRVIVKKGNRTVLTRTVTKRKIVLKRGALPKGKLRVIVRARNAKGFGPQAQKKFKVKKKARR